jgi:hypothetical protein
MIFAQAAACGNARVGPIISPAIQISVYSLEPLGYPPTCFSYTIGTLNFFYVDNGSKFWHRLGCVVVSFDSSGLYVSSSRLRNLPGDSRSTIPSVGRSADSHDQVNIVSHSMISMKPALIINFPCAIAAPAWCSPPD